MRARQRLTVRRAACDFVRVKIRPRRRKKGGLDAVSRPAESGPKRQISALDLYSLGFLHEWNAACNFDFAFGAGQVVGLLAAGRLSKFADGPAGRGPPKSGALHGSVKHYFFAKRSCPIERDGR